MPPRTGSTPIPIKFGSFDVTSQVFHRTVDTFALVNLKPLLPGHILICPLANTSTPPPPPPPSHLHSLTPSQTAHLFQTVNTLTPTLGRLYTATSFNVAVQDGVDAGQSVPHVHVHVVPRSAGDMDWIKGGGDRLYEMIEEGDFGQERGKRSGSGTGEKGGEVDTTAGGGQERRERTLVDMEDEAAMLRRELRRDGVVSCDDDDDDGDDGGGGAGGAGVGATVDGQVDDAAAAAAAADVKTGAVYANSEGDQTPMLKHKTKEEKKKKKKKKKQMKHKTKEEKKKNLDTLAWRPVLTNLAFMGLGAVLATFYLLRGPV